MWVILKREGKIDRRNLKKFYTIMKFLITDLEANGPSAIEDFSEYPVPGPKKIRLHGPGPEIP